MAYNMIENLSTLKINELLIHTPTRMILKVITLKEARSKRVYTARLYDSIMGNPRNNKTHLK